MAFNYINSNGVIVPDTADINAEVQQEYKDAFGDDIVLTPDSPAGVLVTAETASRGSVAANNAQLANQINPETSEGIFLDAIAALTDTQRLSATFTTVEGTITGANGTIIPAGSRAKSGDNSFETISENTIPVSGTINVQFQSVEAGEIPCPINTLTEIETGVLGWETVDNSAAGVLGQNQESDQVFRRRRKDTLSIQGVALPFAIKSNIRAIDGVKSLSFLENKESTTEIIENITLLGHSIYLCIDGGTNDDIANALYASKTLGANYNGSETVVINPTDSDAPYTVKFDRPDLIDIYINITVKVTGAGEDPVTTVKNAILDYANGATEEAGFSVGNNVSCFELSASVSSQTNYFVSSCETSLDNISFDSTTKTIELDQKAQTFDAFITVTVL